MNIIVTGASRGLGLEIARHQLEAGHRLYMVSRTVTPELEALIAKHPQNSTVIPFNLSDLDAIKPKLFGEAIGTGTPIHGLVNNAAIPHSDLASNLNLDSVEQVFRVNVFAPLQLSNLVIRNMLLHKTPGSLVHISSVSAHTGFKGLTVYGATKGAIEAMSKNLAREWGSVGIRSNCVVPGFMETAMSSSLTEDQRQSIYRRTALRRAVEVKSAAASVGFLLSPESSSITSEELKVDCGAI